MEVLHQHHRRLQLVQLEAPRRQHLECLAPLQIGVHSERRVPRALRQPEPLGEQRYRLVYGKAAAHEADFELPELRGRRVRRLKGERLLHQLRHRPEGGPRRVRATAAFEPGVRLGHEPLPELVAQPRLPESRFALHEHRLARSLDYARPRIGEHGKLGLPADEARQAAGRHVEAASDCARLHDPIEHDRLGHTLQALRAPLLDDEDARHESLRRCAEAHAARLRRGLDACGDVRRVAEHVGCIAAAMTDDDRTGVNADSDRELGVGCGVWGVVIRHPTPNTQPPHCLDNCQARAHGALGVIAM